MDNVDENDRLVLVALQLIQQSIVRLPLQIAANLTTAHGSPAATNAQQSTSGLAAAMRQATQGTAWNPTPSPPPPPPPPTVAQRVGNAASSVASFATNNQATRAVSSGASAIIGGLVARFGALFGPMQLLNQVVSSQTSGFQVLGTAVKVLAATIGPIILPVVTVFAATMVAASDVLWSKLLPNLDRFNKFVLGQLIPAGEGLVGLFGKLSSAITWIISKTGGSEDGDGPLAPFKKIDSSIDKFLDGDIKGGAKDLTAAAVGTVDAYDPTGLFKRVAKWSGAIGDDKAGGITPGGPTDIAAKSLGVKPGGAGGASGGFGDAMRDTLKELRLSLGTKASYSGLGDVSRNATLAAANTSPFEAKIIERMDAILRSLEAAATPEARAAFPVGAR